MAPKFLLFLIVVVGTNGLSAQPKNQDDLKMHELRGKVKSVRMISYYDIENADSLMNALKASANIQSPDSYREFDYTGNQIEYKGFDRDGDLMTRTVKIFNAGKLMEESSFDGEGNPDSKQTCEYNRQGKPVKENYFDSRNNLIAYYTNKYDDAGYLSERRQHKSDGSVDWTKLYKNDLNGNPVEFKEIGADGGLNAHSKTSYSYFADKSIKQLTQEVSSGSQPGKLITTFDEKGNRLSDSAVGANDETLGTRQYMYDENGNLIEEVTLLPDGSVAQKVIQRFNGQGDRVEHTVYETDDAVRSKREYRYHYDAKGNWILRMEIADSHRFTIDQREIEYHED